jgi:hypothetical protein
MKQCVYSVLCDCGKTGKSLEVCIMEHKDNPMQGLLKKSKLAQYEEGHKISCKDMKVLQIEPNTTYRKYKESAYMSVA